jgi:hypothetical protein
MTSVVKNLQQLLMNIVKGEKLERTQDLMWFGNVYVSPWAMIFYFSLYVE